MGTLIVIEGLDGSGKATQTKALYDHLKADGYRVHRIEFPDYADDSSALVRMYLGGAFGDKAADGSQLRPYIVWFGEYLGPEAQEAIHLIKYADIFVVIGTTLVVYPAAGFVKYAHPEVPKFLIDPSDMNNRIPEGFKHIKASATEGIDLLLNELEKL